MNSPNPYSSKNPSVFDVFRHITGGRLIFSVVSLAIIISLSAVSLLLMVGYDQGDFAEVSRLHQSRDITVPFAYAPPRADESMIKLRPGTDPGLFPAIDFPPEAELVDTDRTHGFYTYLTRDELVDFIAKYGEFDDKTGRSVASLSLKTSLGSVSPSPWMPLKACCPPSTKTAALAMFTMSTSPLNCSGHRLLVDSFADFSSTSPS